MRSGVLALAIAAAFAPSFGGAVRADHLPAFVVPGRADVPVIINGYDASWGVVESDWGLYRPGAVAPVVITAPNAGPASAAHHYFPSLGGVTPRLGRYEIEPSPNRVLPPPAESFHRTWSSGSDPVAPVTEYAPSPPIIVAPPDARRHWHPHH